MSDTIQRWSIGDVTLTAIVEAESAGIPTAAFFPEATTSDVQSLDWLPEGAADPAGSITFRVQAFVLELAGKTILVDPCVGNGKKLKLGFWNDLQLPWLERFATRGL